MFKDTLTCVICPQAAAPHSNFYPSGKRYGMDLHWIYSLKSFFYIQHEPHLDKNTIQIIIYGKYILLFTFPPSSRFSSKKLQITIQCFILLRLLAPTRISEVQTWHLFEKIVKMIFSWHEAKSFFL